MWVRPVSRLVLLLDQKNFSSVGNSGINWLNRHYFDINSSYVENVKKTFHFFNFRMAWKLEKSHIVNKSITAGDKSKWRYLFKVTINRTKLLRIPRFSNLFIVNNIQPSKCMFFPPLLNSFKTQLQIFTYIHLNLS